jgi:uncharacterized protein YsxB (DUF464 family)
VIKVKIERNQDGSIRSFTVKGHAFYADPGKDIVCAGVSAVTVGTVNAIEALAGVELVSRMEIGYLQAAVPEQLIGNKPEQIQLLLESMVVMLQTIQESYGDYIAIRDVRR